MRALRNVARRDGQGEPGRHDLLRPDERRSPDRRARSPIPRSSRRCATPSTTTASWRWPARAPSGWPASSRRCSRAPWIPSQGARTDRDRARALLKEANLGEVKGALTYASDSTIFGVQMNLLAQKIQADLAAVGIGRSA